MHFQTPLLTFALAALSTATTIPSEPLTSPTNTLSSRDSSQFVITVFPDGGCQSFESRGFTINPGQCTTYNMGSGTYGAKISNSNQQCVIKFWENDGCSGAATTYYLSPQRNTGCVATANNGGVFKVGNGIRSLVANCAKDYA